MARERAESDWTDEHPEYDIERELFPSHVGEMAQPIYMWDVDVTWEQLGVEAPHCAYVVDCYSRSARLVKVLRSLSTVEKMLWFDTFPVVTPGARSIARNGSAPLSTSALRVSRPSVTACSC